MGTLKNIYEGWSNWLKSKIPNALPSHIKEQAEKRAEICVQCPHFDGDDKKCKMCGCSFPAIVYAPDKTCPVGKWGEMTDGHNEKP